MFGGKTKTTSALLLVLLTLDYSSTTAFVVVAPSPTARPPVSSSSSFTTALSETTADSSGSSTTTTTKASSFSVPISFNEMVNQASTCMKQAAQRGDTRQMIRVLLPRDATSGDFGKYLEEDAAAASSGDISSNSAALLTPPDESWQGGIMQLYRAAAPTCTAILRKVVSNQEAGLPPRISEDRSVDESGVDGVGLFQTDDDKITCWLQPTQELVDLYVDSAKQTTTSADDDDDDRIVVLMNPQWRLVDDALDSASQESGFLGGLASFLGGKGGVLKQLKEVGFKPVYTLEGYVCRGSNVRLLQTLDSDWSVFCERDDGETFVPVGTSPTRPSYQDVEKMLDDSDIGYKYARDVGLQPKL